MKTSPSRRLDSRTEAPSRDQAVQSQAGQYPAVRMRRNRKSAWSRRLVQENVLTTSDLIWPIFLIDGATRRVPVDHMPGVDRLNIEEAVAEAERGRNRFRGPRRF